MPKRSNDSNVAPRNKRNRLEIEMNSDELSLETMGREQLLQILKLSMEENKKKDKALEEKERAMNAVLSRAFKEKAKEIESLPVELFPAVDKNLTSLIYRKIMSKHTLPTAESEELEYQKFMNDAFTIILENLPDSPLKYKDTSKYAYCNPRLSPDFSFIVEKIKSPSWKKCGRAWRIEERRGYFKRRLWSSY